MGISLYEACAYFLMYSFLGWVAEVAYNSVVLGHVENRGFLNGPACPLYGTGALIVLCGVSLLGGGLAPEDVSSLVMFFGGVALLTLLELVVGVALERLFHTKWWDYSDKPFNFHGYICLQFSLLWGFAVLLAVKCIHPFVRNLTVGLVPERVGLPICVALLAVMVVDAALSSASGHGMDRRLGELARLHRLMLVPSDAMSEAIGTGSIHAAEVVQNGHEKASLAVAEVRERAGSATHAATQAAAQAAEEYERRLEELADEISRRRPGGPGRLMRAFPDMSRSGEDERDILRELGHSLCDRVPSLARLGSRSRVDRSSRRARDDKKH